MQADDPEHKLYQFIPPSYAKSLDAFHAVVEREADEFRPLGTRVGAFRERALDEDEDEDEEGEGGKAEQKKDKGKGKGKAQGPTGTKLPLRNFEIIDDGDAAGDGDDEIVYEAYHANWATPGFKEFHRRMQIFVLLYIEAASYLDEEDERWEFICLSVVPARVHFPPETDARGS